MVWHRWGGYKEVWNGLDVVRWDWGVLGVLDESNDLGTTSKQKKGTKIRPRHDLGLIAPQFHQSYIF